MGIPHPNPRWDGHPLYFALPTLGTRAPESAGVRVELAAAAPSSARWSGWTGQGGGLLRRVETGPPGLGRNGRAQAGGPGCRRISTIDRTSSTDPNVTRAYRTPGSWNELPMPTRNSTAARKTVIRT